MDVAFEISRNEPRAFHFFTRCQTVHHGHYLIYKSYHYMLWLHQFEEMDKPFILWSVQADNYWAEWNSLTYIISCEEELSFILWSAALTSLQPVAGFLVKRVIQLFFFSTQVLKDKPKCKGGNLWNGLLWCGQFISESKERKACSI